MKFCEVLEWALNRRSGRNCSVSVQESQRQIDTQMKRLRRTIRTSQSRAELSRELVRR